MTQVERRTSSPPELRDGQDGRTLTGYAAVFNQETVIGGQFREVVARGAFREVLRTTDCVCLFNHNPDVPLARVSNGTLTLSEDAHGLRYVAKLNPEDPDATKVLARVKRGDVVGSSFSFSVGRDGDKWTPGIGGELPLRTLVRVSDLYDVSPVTAPAYPTTSVGARQAAVRAMPAAVAASRGASPGWRLRTLLQIAELQEG